MPGLSDLRSRPNVLVVGSGGREHAIAWKLAQSPRIGRIVAAPGNPGIGEVAECVSVQATDVAGLVRLAREAECDLVVVGPEAPLAAGLADAVRREGIAVFGPSAAAARIESSKHYAKGIMARAGIPTAHCEAFADPDRARDAARAVVRQAGGVVVKLDSLAAGKGVVVAASPEEAARAVDELYAMGGGHGCTLLVEERLVGPEASVMCISDGADILVLPPARDHKRALDGDQGPNTGGMGAVAPAELVSGKAAVGAGAAAGDGNGNGNGNGNDDASPAVPIANSRLPISAVHTPFPIANSQLPIPAVIPLKTAPQSAPRRRCPRPPLPGGWEGPASSGSGRRSGRGSLRQRMAGCPRLAA